MATQKNKLEEVIHLYLGCEVQVRGDIEKLIGVESDGAVITFSGRYGRRIWGAKEVKPLLRQLSDITEGEVNHCWIILDWSENITTPSKRRELLNEEFLDTDEGRECGWFSFCKLLPYLLKQGFDLFSLIETGQAIDKNTLQGTKN